MKSCEPNTNDKLLRKKEVAVLLACSTRAVDRLEGSGRLKRVKSVGVRYRASDVQAIISGSGL
jgi:predicted DNA-binding transcriptional regulator AlpA